MLMGNLLQIGDFFAEFLELLQESLDRVLLDTFLLLDLKRFDHLLAEIVQSRRIAALLNLNGPNE